LTAPLFNTLVANGLNLLAFTISIRPGGSATFAATLTRSGGNIGAVNLTVAGVPLGVGFSVTRAD